MRKVLFIGFIAGLLVALGAPVAGWLIYGPVPLNDLTWGMSLFLVISGIGFAISILCGIRQWAG